MRWEEMKNTCFCPTTATVGNQRGKTQLFNSGVFYLFDFFFPDLRLAEWFLSFRFWGLKSEFCEEAGRNGEKLLVNYFSSVAANWGGADFLNNSGQAINSDFFCDLTVHI